MRTLSKRSAPPTSRRQLPITSSALLICGYLTFALSPLFLSGKFSDGTFPWQTEGSYNSNNLFQILEDGGLTWHTSSRLKILCLCSICTIVVSPLPPPPEKFYRFFLMSWTDSSGNKKVSTHQSVEDFVKQVPYFFEWLFDCSKRQEYSWSRSRTLELFRRRQEVQLISFFRFWG